MKKVLTIIGSIIAILAGAIFIGLQILPAPFDPIVSPGGDLDTISIPDGLPEPVERFYRTIYGKDIPVIETAVISGRAKLVINGIKFPARFRFTHNAGQDYHHNIEVSLFGIPIMKVDESYINGYSRMVLPFGTIEGEPKINQAANLGLWAESIWFPALFLTDGRVSWNAVDDETALLNVPFEDSVETFTVKFNKETGLVDSIEAMRFREADSQDKILWRNEALEWGEIDGQSVMTVAAVAWQDQGKPWAIFTIEEIDYNVDTSFAITK